MKDILPAIQIIIDIILIAAILLQSRGTGLSATWGGGSESYQSRRGVEKTLFAATIIFTILFLLVQIVALAL